MEDFSPVGMPVEGTVAGGSPNREILEQAITLSGELLCLF
jgi:hypothetical protein